MESVTKVWEWAKARAMEVSTWDGLSLVVLSAGVLLAAPFVKYLAIAGVVYGGYRILQSEKTSV